MVGHVQGSGLISQDLRAHHAFQKAASQESVLRGAIGAVRHESQHQVKNDAVACKTASCITCSPAVSLPHLSQAWDVIQLVDCLPSKHGTQDLIL